MKYVCELCGSVYDEDLGDPKQGIPAGTAFELLPSIYYCVCGSEKESFCKLGRQSMTFSVRTSNP